MPFKRTLDGVQHYVPRGSTVEPCHGCGREVVRIKDRVCSDCKAVLSHASAMRLEPRSALGEVAKQRAAVNMVPMLLQERSYALPYVHHLPTELRGRVQNAFHRLSMLASQHPDASVTRNDVVKVDGSAFVWPYGKHERAEWQLLRVIDADAARALREAYAAVVDGTQAAYAEGFQRGKALLAQLASGEITADKFNDTVLRETSR